MSCQRCKSDRILKVSAKCSDGFMSTFDGRDYEGYVPGDIGIGGGDYIQFDLCMDCGQIQGDFPLGKAELETSDEADDLPEDLLDVDISAAYTPPTPPQDIPDPSDKIPDSSIPEVPDFGSSSSDFGGGGSSD
jgi:hypothetical protein